MDEMTRKNKEKNLENYKREIESIKNQKEDISKKLVLFIRKTELLDANYKLVLENFHFHKPTWDYETLPAYMENLKAINEISQEENRLMWASQIKQTKQGLESLDEQLKSLYEAIEKVTTELAEDKGDEKNE